MCQRERPCPKGAHREYEAVVFVLTVPIVTFETDRECCIRSYHVYGKTVEAKLYEDDTKERQFHIYYNPSMQAAERELLEQTLDRMKTYLDKHIGDTQCIRNG